jgi:hypothetical protein
VATLLGTDEGSVPTHPQVNVVSPGYFQTIGSAILSGRDFRSSDREGTSIVNQEMARRFWHGDAVGQRIVRRDKTLTIVGVVTDSSRRGYREGANLGLYLPVTQESREDISLVVRSECRRWQCTRMTCSRMRKSRRTPGSTSDLIEGRAGALFRESRQPHHGGELRVEE